MNFYNLAYPHYIYGSSISMFLPRGKPHSMQSMHSTKFTRRTAVTTRLLRAFSHREWIPPPAPFPSSPPHPPFVLFEMIFRRTPRVYTIFAATRVSLFLAQPHTYTRSHKHAYAHIRTYITAPDRYLDDRYAHVPVFFLFVFASFDPFAIPWQAARIAVRPNQDAGSEVRCGTHFKMNFSPLSFSLFSSLSSFLLVPFSARNVPVK